jgi:hypothetical protein
MLNIIKGIEGKKGVSTFSENGAVQPLIPETVLSIKNTPSESYLSQIVH